MMLKVKICGITNLEDALHAVACGADALGFVFYEKSPRSISVEKAKAIVQALPPFVERVGLFVNVNNQIASKMCLQAGMSTAQIHFDVDKSYLDLLDVKSLPVIRAKCAEDVQQYADSYRLVDAYCEAFGGSGKRLNLDWFTGVDCSKIILAGGLDDKNISEIKQLGFYAVDVSSGVESIKGKKDPLKVKQFIANAKSL